MKNAIRLVAVGTIGVSLAACASFADKVQELSNNYQRTVASINADIAATAPLVATACSDLQKYAILIVPFLPSNGKAPQYIAAANGAINAYCQAPPTDIATTLVQVNAAVNAAKSGYNNVTTGK